MRPERSGMRRYPAADRPWGFEGGKWTMIETDFQPGDRVLWPRKNAADPGYEGTVRKIIVHKITKEIRVLVDFDERTLNYLSDRTGPGRMGFPPESLRKL